MPTRAAHNESVNRRFRYIVVTLYLMVVGVMVWQFGLQWQGYRDAHEAQKQFVVVQAALSAMADVSRERRPAVGVLMLEASESAKWRLVLDDARRATDRQMDALGAALHDADCDQCAAIAPSWDSVRAQLVQARQGLDAMQLATHTDADIVDGFNQIVRVIPRLSTIAQVGATGVIRENADVQSYLLVARLSGLLREQAGLVAQQFAPSLVKHRPLTDEEELEIAASMGKIEQLRQLLVPSIRVLPPDLLQDYGELDRRYYGEAVVLLNHLRQEATRASGTNATLMELSDRYGPLVAPIDRFRDDALVLASATIDRSLHRHLLYLLASEIGRAHV